MLRFYACILGIATTMTACAAQTPHLEESPLRPPIQATLTQECPALSALSDGSGAAVLRKLIEVSEKYYECRRKHSALVEAVTP